MIKWVVVSFGVMITLFNFGCGGSNQLGAGTIYDATIQVNVAKQADAGTLASQELADAEQMLTQAETALRKGEQNQAYRFGMRAYLKARVAEAIAIASRKEEHAATVTEELESKVQTVEVARRRFEEAEDELEKLTLTSP